MYGSGWEMGFQLMQRISLQEGEAQIFSFEDLDVRLVAEIQRQWSRFIQIDQSFGSQPAGVVLKVRGYVGRLVMPNVLTLEIIPKVPIRNLLGMVETAYELDAVHIFSGESQYAEIYHIYEVFADLLAKKIKHLTQRGLFQDYLTEEGQLSYVKGRLLVSKQPMPLLQCKYDVLSADSIHNRIILWTLFLLSRYPFQYDAVRQVTRRALQAMAREIKLESIDGTVWRNLRYHRLNKNYRSVHVLCRFFIEHCGPLLGQGDISFSPFVLFMPRLFERFVVSWLRGHIKSGLVLQDQYYTPLGGSGDLGFKMDMVLQEENSGKTLAVLDTKYKANSMPTTEDVQQVVAYAVLLDISTAYLIYPVALNTPLEVQIGKITVKAIGMDLTGSLNTAGSELCQELDNLEISN